MSFKDIFIISYYSFVKICVEFNMKIPKGLIVEYIPVNLEYLAKYFCCTNCDSEIIQVKFLDGCHLKRGEYMFDTSGFSWSNEIINENGTIEYYCDTCAQRIDTKVHNNTVYINRNDLYLAEYVLFIKYFLIITCMLIQCFPFIHL